MKTSPPDHLKKNILCTLRLTWTGEQCALQACKTSSSLSFNSSSRLKSLFKKQFVCRWMIQATASLFTTPSFGQEMCVNSGKGRFEFFVITFSLNVNRFVVAYDRTVGYNQEFDWTTGVPGLSMQNRTAQARLTLRTSHFTGLLITYSHPVPPALCRTPTGFTNTCKHVGHMS